MIAGPILAPPAGDPVPVDRLGRVHLVGVGGAGMSGIARLLLARGLTVSGCDAHDSRTLAELRALGAAVSVGHAAGHARGVDTLVLSSAVRADNPDLVAAGESGLRVLPRAAALASLMLGRRAVAVAGTHGKTTTTSMLATALQHVGLDPSYAIGGELAASGSNAHDGTGRLFVAEADESDGSFLWNRPEVAVVTNIEADHLDSYGDEAAYVAAFDAFVGRLLPGGRLVACADDAGSAALAERARGRGHDVVTYGTVAGSDVRLAHLHLGGAGSTSEVVEGGHHTATLAVGQPGLHNALNAVGALAAGRVLGAPVAGLCEGLAGFTGTRRRFEAKGSAGGVLVFDDYAHHPTEVAAALRAARGLAGHGRVVAVFQPHLYSRTRIFAEQFGTALGLADAVVVMDVYAAREDPEPGVTGALVAAAVPLPAGVVRFEPVWERTAEVAAGLAGSGDLLLTIGAGDVTLVGPAVLELLAVPPTGRPT